jgi:type IV pilus assembly protein PilC
MAVWIYQGKTSTGKSITGEITSRNKDDARMLLKKKRVLVTKLTKKPIEIHLNFRKGVKVKDLARFTRQFSAMNSAGLPLIQCLDTMAEQTENLVLKKAIQQISDDIQGGCTLADSFSKHGNIFSPLYYHMIAAGEVGGILESILTRLAEYLEKADKLQRKIRGAMMYPSFVLVVSVLVVVVLLWKVVPTFAEMLASSGAELPVATQLIMNMSEFVQDYYYLIFILILGIPFLVSRYYKTENGQFHIDKLSLKIPILGDLVRKSNVARFTRTLSALLNGGVPIIDSLHVTSKTVGNKVLEKGIMNALESIKSGQTIADPLSEIGIFPPMVVQMISIGEKTGGLSEMLEKVSVFYEDEVDAAVDALTSLIEPIIIVGLGGIIGFILIAMYMPMFSMATNLG